MAVNVGDDDREPLPDLVWWEEYQSLELPHGTRKPPALLAQLPQVLGRHIAVDGAVKVEVARHDLINSFVKFWLPFPKKSEKALWKKGPEIKIFCLSIYKDIEIVMSNTGKSIYFHQNHTYLGVGKHGGDGRPDCTLKICADSDGLAI